MKYDNPQVPHEVNVSESSHTKTFVRMTIMMILGIVTCFICIYLFFRFFSAYIPFSFEQSITENLFSEKVVEASSQDAQKELQVLADKLANMRAIARDYAKYGENLWQRFKRGKDIQSWYYHAAVKAMSDLEFDAEAVPFYKEFEGNVNQVFGYEE